MAKSGLVFITKSTFTTQSSVSINNCFTSSFTHYLVKRNLVGSVDQSNLNVRLRAASTDASGTNYRRQRLFVSDGTLDAFRGTGENVWNYPLGVAESATFGYAEMWVSNPFEAVRTTAWGDLSARASSNIDLYANVYAHDLTISYDGFSVIPSSGTITGSISVFGLVTA